MLEQIKKAVNEWDALDIECRALLFRSNALHGQLDKFRMDRYNLQCKLDKALGEDMLKRDDQELLNLLVDIPDTNATIKKLKEEYGKIRKEYSHTWPKVNKAKKKVEKLKKKFWKQEGLTL